MLFPFKRQYAVIHNTQLIDFDDFEAASEYFNYLDPAREWKHYFRQTKGAYCEPCRAVFVQYIDLPGLDGLLNPLATKEYTLEDYELEKGL